MPLPEMPQWEDDLTTDQLERFRALRDDPHALVASLREDREFQLALARADARPHLVTWFSEATRPTDAWRPDPERSGPIGDHSVGTEWCWTGMHDDEGCANTFQGIPGSGRGVTVRGFTLMGVEDGQFRVRRYVDWAGLFAQLGLTLNWQVPVPSEDRRSGPTGPAS